jgi:hypothetical protein
MSTITHLARVPGKELPQEVPLKPIPVCPPPAVANLHDAHSHPGFTMRQHSAHVENPPVPCEAFVLQQIVHALRRSHHPKVAGIAMRIARRPRGAARSNARLGRAAAGQIGGILLMVGQRSPLRWGRSFKTRTFHRQSPGSDRQLVATGGSIPLLRPRMSAVSPPAPPPGTAPFETTPRTGFLWPSFLAAPGILRGLKLVGHRLIKRIQILAEASLTRAR